MIKKRTWIVKGRLKGMQIPLSIMFQDAAFTTQQLTISYGFVQKKMRKMQAIVCRNGKNNSYEPDVVI
jgi:hypothetical protein